MWILWAARRGLLPYTFLLLVSLMRHFEKRERVVWEMPPIGPPQLLQSWLCPQNAACSFIKVMKASGALLGDFGACYTKHKWKINERLANSSKNAQVL